MVDWSANYKMYNPSATVCSCGKFLPAHYKGYCHDCKLAKDQCSHLRPNGDKAIAVHVTLGGEKIGVCRRCNKVFSEAVMSQESVWKENGSTGGSGFYWRETSYDKWAFRPWTDIKAWSFLAGSGKDAAPDNRLAAIQLLEKWTSLYSRQYALVQCSQCHAFHPSGTTTGWVGDACDDCKSKEPKMKCSKCGVYTAVTYHVTSNGGAYCEKCSTVLSVSKQIAEAAKKPSPVKGDVRKLPKANSPMWTDQWSVMGSAKEPYIVSHRTNGTNGSTTEEGWACACMAFTRHTPREDCKHILKVKLFEGIGLVAKQIVPAGHAKEYATFLKMKAKQDRAKTVDDAGVVKMVGDATGRKFR